MPFPGWYPYRSERARDAYLAFYDSMAASEWPRESEARMVPTSFGKSFVRINGPAGAPPIVLLPGAAATSLLWASNIAALSAGHRTFAVDRMGDVGRNEASRPVNTVDDLIVWLDDLLTGLGLNSGVNLVGLSLGGWLAARYALRHPQRLSKLVLLAPAATVQRTSPEFMLRGIFAALGGRRGVRWVVHWLMQDLVRQNPARAELSVERAAITMRSLQWRRTFMPTPLDDEQLRSFLMPVLFVVGEHEKIYSPERALARLKTVAPQIRTERIAGAGHDLTIVQAELVSRTILAFVG